MVLALVVLSDVFGTLLDVGGLLVVGSGACDDVAGVSVETVERFMEGFAAVLRPPNYKWLLLLC